ncbi:MAG: DUF4179 domain-containing protein [Firmicutes bacterium]|nr:DUF4179 domain-containing protein [Bacillota bacterium]
MFENEEEKLHDIRKQIEQQDIPNSKLDGAILQGMERAKREQRLKRKKRKKGIWTLAISAVLLITLVTSIRVSPAFASAVSSIPGLEKIVAMIQYDKGLTAAIENNYQVIDASQTKDNVELIIDGVVLDESGMIVFYTLQSEENLQNVRIGNVEIKNKELSPLSSSYGITPGDETVNEFNSRINFHFQEPTKLKDLDFTLLMTIEHEGKDVDYKLPFTVPENVKPSIVYELNKEVVIEKQKFTFKKVTIHPLRVDVQISINPNNSKKILQFVDLRLEDENGEVWGSSLNGTIGRGIGDLDQNIYLQSNYFEKPKELYLRINTLQAVHQNEAFVVVDTERKVLINAPKDGKIHLSDSSKSNLDLTLAEVPKDESGSDFSLGTVKDANEKVIRTPEVSMRQDLENSYLLIKFETTDYKNPLSVELNAYPNFIKGDIKLKLVK